MILQENFVSIIDGAKPHRFPGPSVAPKARKRSTRKQIGGTRLGKTKK